MCADIIGLYFKVKLLAYILKHQKQVFFINIKIMGILEIKVEKRGIESNFLKKRRRLLVVGGPT